MEHSGESAQVSRGAVGGRANVFRPVVLQWESGSHDSPAILGDVSGALLVLALFASSAAQVWHSRDLQKPMPAKGNIALESLGNFGNHRANRIQRERSGEAEIHQRAHDLLVIQSGEATLVTGGRVPGAKTTTPGELRGPSIEGGQQQKLAPGDVVHVPAGVPHQILLAPGAHLTYFAMKIDAAAAK